MVGLVAQEMVKHSKIVLRIGSYQVKIGLNQENTRHAEKVVAVTLGASQRKGRLVREGLIFILAV